MTSKAGRILEIQKYMDKASSVVKSATDSVKDIANNSATPSDVAKVTAGAAAGAALLKTHQKMKKMRKRHGSVHSAMAHGARMKTAKGVRKATQHSSAATYKLAKRLEAPRKNEGLGADWKETKKRNPNLAKATAGVSKAAGATASGAKSVAKKAGPALSRDWEKTKSRSHERTMKRIERRKQKVQAKHDLKMHKKRLKADQKLYKYDPLIH